jgi:hypothetical protein
MTDPTSEELVPVIVIKVPGAVVEVLVHSSVPSLLSLKELPPHSLSVKKIETFGGISFKTINEKTSVPSALKEVKAIEPSSVFWAEE